MLTVLYVVPSVYNVWDMVVLLRAPDGPWWMSAKSHRASMYGPGGIETILVFYILLLVAAIAVFFRVRMARYSLLAILACVVFFEVREVVFLASLESNDPAALTSPAD